MTRPDAAFWRRKRVLITGHTGFKGGWLTIWLASMGAETHGLALAPPAGPNLFGVARVGDDMASSTITDIRNLTDVSAVVARVRPEIVFHLAAQAFVRASYERPVETYEVNVMGTVHVLEALRAAPGATALVNVTSDKCYDNQEWPWGYRESDPMGGHDPYSSSKGCAELVTAAYRRSFLEGAGLAVSTARAGNVIGGGDWAPDRLVPDVFRALDARTTLRVRSPKATRPWQHVLEPVAGYLILAERLHAEGTAFSGSWNFGPDPDAVRPVGWVVEHLASVRPDLVWELDTTAQPPEAHSLKLDSSKAREGLGWRPRWSLASALGRTAEWHAAWKRGDDMAAITRAHIDDYLRDDA